MCAILLLYAPVHNYKQIRMCMQIIARLYRYTDVQKDINK